MATETLKVTSPEEYAALARQASEKEDSGFLHKLKKTGAVVRLRRVNMDALAVVGRIPMSLVSASKGTNMERALELAERKSEPTPEEAEEGMKSLIFIRQTVVENCMEPRLGFDAAGAVCFVGADGGVAAYVDGDDLFEMFDVISGEEGADGLKSFRNRKERRASASQSRRKGVRGKAKSTPKGVPARA